MEESDDTDGALSARGAGICRAVVSSSRRARRSVSGLLLDWSVVVQPKDLKSVYAAQFAQHRGKQCPSPSLRTLRCCCLRRRFAVVCVKKTDDESDDTTRTAYSLSAREAVFRVESVIELELRSAIGARGGAPVEKHEVVAKCYNLEIDIKNLLFKLTSAEKFFGVGMTRRRGNTVCNWYRRRGNTVCNWTMKFRCMHVFVPRSSQAIPHLFTMSLLLHVFHVLVPLPRKHLFHIKKKSLANVNTKILLQKDVIIGRGTDYKNIEYSSKKHERLAVRLDPSPISRTPLLIHIHPEKI